MIKRPEEITIEQNIVCYDIAELEPALEVFGLLPEWRNWFAGSTVAISNGKFLVYKYDVDRFLSGEVNDD